jgi:hypothetical protein
MNIEKYSLTEPNADIMIIENGIIKNNRVLINNRNKDKIFLPTMYKGWYVEQKKHITFNYSDTLNVDISNNNILYIFDTWGITSYYHLLIDHIIPVWITQNIIEEYLTNNNKIIGNSDFLRISNNKYPPELLSSNDIFKYFLKNNYKDKISGKYKYIIYGYCYNHRPYNIDYKNKFYEKYQYMLNKFINYFIKPDLQIIREKYIIIPERNTRTYENIDDIYEKLSSLYNIKRIDYSKLSIDKQISITSSAWAMIGCEGAAFSNILFMKSQSLIICLYTDHTVFFNNLSEYCGHEMYSIKYTNTEYTTIINEIETICKRHLITNPIF